jgi:hypothetical protein
MIHVTTGREAHDALERRRVKQVTRRSRSTHATRWATAGFLLALAASLVMLLAPLGSQVEASSQSSGQTELVEPKVTHPSLLEIQGWNVALPLSVPVLLTGGGLIAAHRAVRPIVIVTAVLLGAFVVLGALSVGIFYAPAEVAVVVAAAKQRP